MEASAFPLDEILSAVKRRLWLMILCVVVVTPIGLVVAVSLQSKYSSTAKILIEDQQIPNSLVRSTVEVSAAERMELLKQRLLTRQNLLDLTDRLNLLKDQPNLSPTAAFNQVLGAIEIKDIRLRSGRGTTQSAAFTITYSSTNPSEAARVANELVSMVLEQNIKTRSQRAAETRVFLQNKVRELAASLTALEEILAEFKIDNEDTLPASLQGRRSELGNLRNRSLELQRQLITLEERKIFLEESLRLGRPALTAAVRLTPEEANLQQLERQLAQVSAIYAASHPDVRRLTSQVAAMQNALTERTGKANDAAEGAGATPTGPESAVNREVASIDRQITSLSAEAASIEERIEILFGSIAETPKIEIALIALERQHTNLSVQYQESVRKEATAADGEDLEINRQAERFSVLEPAQVPEKPDWPPRKLIALGGAGGSVALGALLMLGAELRNQSVRTAGQIERRLDLRPLVTIPMIETKYDARRRLLNRLMVILLIIFAIAAALFLVDRFYLPLDLLLDKILDQAGLPRLALGNIWNG